MNARSVLAVLGGVAALLWPAPGVGKAAGEGPPAQAPQAEHHDRYGHPLPPGALARMGTVWPAREKGHSASIPPVSGEWRSRKSLRT
jgi:hypothetical protein